MISLLIFGISIVVGALGGLLGIGGGVFLIPVLTVLLHVPIKVAIGASLVSVIATSSAAGAVYVGQGLAHVRCGMVLEIATTLGAIGGGLATAAINGRVLEGVFAGAMALTVWGMSRIKTGAADFHPTGLLDTRFRDPASGTRVDYGVRRLPAGLGASLIAGALSGMLGIGGGTVKVPVMTVVMGMPLRAAIATSNLMIGVTAATGALIYLSRGLVVPHIAVPTALGILLGASLEPRLAMHIRTRWIKRAFELLLVALAVEMLVKAVRG